MALPSRAIPIGTHRSGALSFYAFPIGASRIGPRLSRRGRIGALLIRGSPIGAVFIEAFPIGALSSRTLLALVLSFLGHSKKSQDSSGPGSF